LNLLYPATLFRHSSLWHNANLIYLIIPFYICFLLFIIYFYPLNPTYLFLTIFWLLTLSHAAWKASSNAFSSNSHSALFCMFIKSYGICWA
jgi:hypothetical protein